MSISDFELAQIISTDPNRNAFALYKNLDAIASHLYGLSLLLSDARKYAACVTPEAYYRSQNGMHLWECLHLLTEAMQLLTSGPLEIQDIQLKKLIRSLRKHVDSAERQLVTDSMPSFLLFAKPARTGKKSKARSRLVSDVINPKIKYKVTRYNKPPRP